MAHQKTIFKLFLYTLLIPLVGYFINQLPTTALPLPWLLLLLTLCAALSYIFFETDFLRQQANPDLAIDIQSARLQRQLINVVLGEVIERLDSSLYYRIRIDLKRQEEHQRVGRRDRLPAEKAQLSNNWVKRLFKLKASTASSAVEAEQSTAELLARGDVQGRLLILGEPGAGKTNELLAIAKELLQAAQQSQEQPIPIVFELSEWGSGEKRPLENWLCDQLQRRYKVPIAIAQQWIQEGKLFPLLDGLDELKRIDDTEHLSLAESNQKRHARQIQCMRTINMFLDTHSASSMVVCCRRQEYEALEMEGESLKRLNGAIYLQELDDQQIQDYLTASNREGFWEILKQQPALLKQIRSPLFLMLVVVAYQGETIESTEELIDLYIEKQLQDLSNRGAYAPGQTPTIAEAQHYLCWLATKLEQQEVTEFLIERLQPSWLDRECDRERYLLFCTLIAGLIGGLAGMICGPFFGLSELRYVFSFELKDVSFWLDHVPSWLRIGSIVGGIAGSGLIFKLIAEDKRGKKLRLREISLAERGRLSIGKGIREGLMGGFSFGLMTAVMTGLTAWFFVGFNSDNLMIRDGLIVNGALAGFRVGHGLMGALYVGIIYGLSFGLFVWLFISLMIGLFHGLNTYEAEINNKFLPNQGIRESWKPTLYYALGTGLIFGLISGLTTVITDSLSAALLNGLRNGIFIGFVAGIPGLKPLVQHVSLRIVLHRSGIAPWNYAKFLEHAENHRFIQRVGGRYRFVHDLLRKRFAEQYEPHWRY